MNFEIDKKWLQEHDMKNKMVAYKRLMSKVEFTDLFDELQDNCNNKAGLLLILKRTSSETDGPLKLINDMAMRMINRLVHNG